MKRLISILLAVITIAAITAVPALAASPARQPANSCKTVFENNLNRDGTYVKLTFKSEPAVNMRPAPNIPEAISESNITERNHEHKKRTITAERSTYYLDKSGEKQWEAILKAEFSYDELVSEAKDAKLTLTIYNPDWYEINRITMLNGNTATGTLELGYRFLGITVNTSSYSVKVSCDKDGNLK